MSVCLESARDCDATVKVGKEREKRDLSVCLDSPDLMPKLREKEAARLFSGRERWIERERRGDSECLQLYLRMKSQLYLRMKSGLQTMSDAKERQGREGKAAMSDAKERQGQDRKRQEVRMVYVPHASRPLSSLSGSCAGHALPPLAAGCVTLHARVRVA